MRVPTENKYMAQNQICLAAARKYPWLALHAQIHSSQPLNSLIYQSRRDKLTPLLDHKLRKFG